jgi:MFS-type transporter involved in bile tolerance (Atg22 family)
LFFAGAVAVFGRSQPAILSLVAFFVIGGMILLTVDVQAGRAVALAEDRGVLSDIGPA